MKLVVLGATGGTGLELVRQAIEHGHSVTALVRSPDRLKPFQRRITIEPGDPLNAAELERVIQGHDAVLSGFGPRVPVSKADAHLLQEFAVISECKEERSRGIQEDRFQSSGDHEKPERRNRKGRVSTLILLTGPWALSFQDGLTRSSEFHS